MGLIYLALVGFFAFSVAVLWAVFHPALLPAVERLLARIGLARLGPHLDDLALRLGGFRGRRGLFVGMFAVSTLTQLSRIGVHVLVARSLGLNVSLTYFFLFVPLLAVIVSLPISLNGIGVREGAGIVLFGLVGVDRVHAFSLQFLTYVVAVAVSLLGGFVFLARIPRRRAQARAQEKSAWQ
jgi:glycosyltransferase 2 family protein